jgi:RES domain-containing protein
VAAGVLWRIARRPHALDRRGVGARDHGGRWNVVGTSVIYAGRTVGIVALEAFVHLAGLVPPDLVLVRIDLPDGCSFEEPSVTGLPPHWNAIPPAPGSQEYGTRWARKQRSLVLFVPSALAPEERNAVLNPGHPQFPSVRMVIARSFLYDPRMFRPRAVLRRRPCVAISLQPAQAAW